MPISLNSAFRHYVWALCPRTCAQLVHRSSDRIFSISQNGPKRSLLRTLSYAYLILGVVRFYSAALAMVTGQTERYLRMDPLMRVGIRMGLINPIACASAALLPYFALYLHYMVYCRRYNYVWRWVADVMVANQRGFGEDNPHMWLLSDEDWFSELVKNPLEVGRNLYTTVRLLWSEVDREDGQIHPTERERVKFRVRRLRYHPSMTPDIRARLVVVAWATQTVHSAFLLGTALVIATGAVYYNFYLLVPNLPNYLQPDYWIALFDMLAICTGAFHTLKILYFLISVITLIRFGVLSLFKPMTSGLRRAICHLTRGQHQHQSQYQSHSNCHHIYGWYLDEVRRLLLLAIVSNTYIVAPLLTTVALSQLPLNVYLVSALHFIRMSNGDRTLIGCLLGMQFLLCSAAVGFFVELSNALHRTAQPLYRGQGALALRTIAATSNGGGGGGGGGFVSLVRLKLKLASMYERLHAEDRFHFTMGTLGAISSNNLLEFLFVYSGYLMFAFGMVHRMVQNQESSKGN